MSGRPLSTYRLQLTPTFGFRDAAALVPYLRDLGITHLYLSPPFEAQPGSAHGYDVTDLTRLRAELGGEAGWNELAEAVRAGGLGTLVDFVPNHMGIGPANAWWMDILENGPSSVHASYFDIDWHPLKQELENKVLVPVLGDQFGAVLERGELTLEREEGTFRLRYYDKTFPVAPRQVPRLLVEGLSELVAELGDSDLHLQELQSIVASLTKLAPRAEPDHDKITERAREKEVAKRRLAALFEASPRIRAHVDANLVLFNGTPGDPRTFDRLEALLADQAYRLAHWRVAGEEINYRRFFDVNELAAIRMEDEHLFEEAHRLVLRLACAGQLDGLRIDHPDGLYRPTAYFNQLRAALAQACPGREPFLVIEKILDHDERVPASWAVDGTTGYDFLNLVGGIFVDRRNAPAFLRLYRRFTGASIGYDALVYEKKKVMMRSSMAGELSVLSHWLNRISERDRRTRDFTLGSLSRALTEYVACLPIYRTYVEGEGGEDVDSRDRQYIERTIAQARRRLREVDVSVLDFLAQVLLLDHPEHLPAEARTERVEFVRKVQQVTGPINAKAVEDTVFYVYNPLVALNEVGGHPRAFGTSIEEFHRMNAERLASLPGSLSTTSTHDTKRSEDVRVRIAALSEVPDDWGERTRAWARMNRRWKTRLEGELAPDRNDEYLLYQTLVGVFPDQGLDPEHVDETLVLRVRAYMSKAAKEAKLHTSWTNPDEAYEKALAGFVTGVLHSPAFLAAFVPFHRRIAAAGRISSLAQVAIRACAPGVTDVYQGAELWDLSLVDPDNRRPVDFARRRAILDDLAARAAQGADARWALAREVSRDEAMPDGRAKLLLVRETLHLRQRLADVFVAGEYLPLSAEGEHERHVVAFARRSGTRVVLCVAPRLTASGRHAVKAAAGRWRARLPLPPDLQIAYTDVVSGARISPTGDALDVHVAWQAFPVLVAEGRARLPAAP